MSANRTCFEGIYVEPDRQRAIDALRTAIVLRQNEAKQIRSLIENGANPAVRLWAQGDLERLEKRIVALVEELATLESE
jgi:hypothetical protein